MKPKHSEIVIEFESDTAGYFAMFNLLIMRINVALKVWFLINYFKIGCCYI